MATGKLQTLGLQPKAFRLEDISSSLENTTLSCLLLQTDTQICRIYIHVQVRLFISLTSYSGLLELVKLSLDEAQHQTGLPYRWLPEQDQLELEDLIGCRGGTGPAGRHGRTLLLVGCHKLTLSQTQTQALVVAERTEPNDPSWSQVSDEQRMTCCHAVTHKKAKCIIIISITIPVISGIF